MRKKHVFRWKQRFGNEASLIWETDSLSRVVRKTLSAPIQGLLVKTMVESLTTTNLTWAELALEIDLGQCMGVVRLTVAACAEANQTTFFG